MNLNNDVINVLANSQVNNNVLFLPEGQLERKLYLDVNKALTGMKGKWNRKEKGHIFPHDPTEMIENAIQTGEVVTAITEKKKFQFFETPSELADRMVNLTALSEDCNKFTICEPSAGQGRIIEAIHQVCPDQNVSLCELMPDNIEHLKTKGYNVYGTDFLETTDRFDIFIANPPFSKQQDIDHVNHMLDLSDMLVVSVMSSSVMWRENKKAVDFRNRVNDLGGRFIELDHGEFKESGTMIKACIMVCYL